MNRLKIERQKMILNLLVEGNSIRSIERVTDTHRDTIMRLMCRVGENCQDYLDSHLRKLKCKYVECDEIWTYVFKKQGKLKPTERLGEMGDQYVFVALDRDTKLVPVFLVGKRNKYTATIFMQELQKRITNRFQLSTDKFKGYLDAVETAFGCEIDYAQLQKIYHSNGDGRREGYSPSHLLMVEISKIMGNPNPNKICTSYIERQNLTIRTQLKRFTRLTNAFSKKLENLKAALAIHFWHYNFMRYHRTLRMTPAMAAGIRNTFAKWGDIIVN